MGVEIRHIRQTEWPLLEDFLYEAIFVPEGFEGEVPRSVVHDDPKCRAAFEGFGSLPDDHGVVAEVDGKVVGACWARTTDEYGHIDCHTPSLALSLYGSYRGQGIGSALLGALLDELRNAGYAKVSLSVQKENPALRLYERAGFRIVGDGADVTEWLMVCHPSDAHPLEMRRTGPDDIPVIVDMRVAQLIEEGAGRLDELVPALFEHYERHLADRSFLSWLACDGGRVVATSGVSVVEKPPYPACPTGRIALVSGMYTLPAYRRLGIARDLLCRVVDDARCAGCGVVQITASNAGVPLYRSIGFAHNHNFLQLSLQTRP